MKKMIGVLCIATLLLQACQPDKLDVTGKVLGYKPIYSNDASLFNIQNLPAQPVKNAGKIYVKGNYIFQNEIGEGIHIIDNSNTANAQRVGFIKIKGSEEISIKGNYLYSNNYTDLVTIDITNIAQAVEVNRIKNTFINTNSSYAPPVRSSYFECVDISKGVVVGWAQDSVLNPKCRN
jgi:hypothetical protein